MVKEKGESTEMHLFLVRSTRWIIITLHKLGNEEEELITGRWDEAVANKTLSFAHSEIW